MQKDGSDVLRGQIYWTTLDPAVGSEISKTRPAIVVSNDIQNTNAPRVIVVPVTSSKKRVLDFETLVQIGGDLSKAMADQVRTVDKSRLGELICKITSDEMARLDAALKIVMHLR